MYQKWSRKVARRSTQSSGAVGGRRRWPRRPATLLRLEPLEDRTVLSNTPYQDLAQNLYHLNDLQQHLTQVIDKVQHIPFLDQPSAQLGDLSQAQIITGSLLSDLGSALTLHSTDQGVQDAMKLISGVQDASVTSNTQNGNFIEVDLHLHQDATTGPQVNLSFSLNGLPININTTGGVDVKVGFDYELDFGYSFPSGFFLVNKTLPNSTDQLGIEATVGLQSSSSFDATVGVLHATLKDFANDPTNLDVTFHLAQAGSTISAPTLSGRAHVSLFVDGGFTFKNAQLQLPSVTSHFVLDWGFSGNTLDPNDLSVKFEHVSLDLGKLISSYVEPIVNVIQEVTAPIEPIISLLVAPIPGVSDFSHLIGHGDVSLLDVIKVAAPQVLGPEVEPLVDLAAALVQLVNDIDTKINNQNQTITLDLGDFDLDSQADKDQLVNGKALFGNLNNPDSTDLGVDLTPNGVNTTITNGMPSVQNELNANNVAQDVVTTVGEIANVVQNGFHFDFPIIDDPASAFQLLLGKDVDLFTFEAQFASLPTGNNLFSGSFFGGNVSFPIDLKIDALLRVGYDTRGFREFFQHSQQNAADLLDGFFVDDASHLSFTGKVGARIGDIPLPGVQVIVGGGLTTGNDGHDPLRITFDDPNQGNDGGKARFNQLDPTCLFDGSGELDASLDVTVKAGFTIFGQFVGVSHDFNYAKLTLEDFGPPPGTCLGKAQQNLTLFTYNSTTGTLTLSLGGQDVQNYLSDTHQTREAFRVEHDPDQSASAGDGETIDVIAFGLKQSQAHGKHITADASGLPLDQDITIDSDVFTGADLTGGPQKNRLAYLGSGDATLTGGGGDSQLFGGSGANLIQGGSGNDVLVGGTGVNILRAGSGWDQLFAGPHDDHLFGGSGDDTFTAGAGFDRMTGGSANNTYLWEEGDGRLEVTGQGASNTLVVTGTNQGDVFTADPDIGTGVVVLAPGGVIVHGTQIQTLNLDGTAGGNTYTVHDLSRTVIQSVNLNAHEAAGAGGPPSQCTVDGSPALINLVTISAQQVQVPEGPGVVTLVDLRTPSQPGTGNPGSHYRVRAAIPQRADTLTVNTGTAPDDVSVLSAQARGTVYVNTFDGDDTINVGTVNPGKGLGLLDTVRGDLYVDAGAGALNQLNVDESEGLNGDSLAMTANLVFDPNSNQFTTIGRILRYKETDLTVPEGDLTHRYPMFIQYVATGGQLGAGVNMYLTRDNDTLDIAGTLPDAPTTVYSDGVLFNHANDQVVVGYNGIDPNSPMTPQQSTLDRILSPLDVEGSQWGFVFVGETDVQVFDEAPQTAEQYLVTDSAVVRAGAEPITYHSLGLSNAPGRLGLFAADVANSITMQATARFTDTRVTAGDGHNQIFVGARRFPFPFPPQYFLDRILSPVTIHGGIGTNDLTIDDEGNGAGLTYLLAADQLFRLGNQQIPAVTVNFSNLTSLVLDASDNGGSNQNDGIGVSGTPAGVPVTVNAGNGGASLSVGPLDDVRGALELSWTQGTKTLLFEDSNTHADEQYLLQADRLDRTGAAEVRWGHGALSTLVLVPGFPHWDSVNVPTTAQGTSVAVAGGQVQTAVTAGDLNQGLDLIHGPLDVDGTFGPTRLLLDDRNGGVGKSYQLDAASLAIPNSAVAPVSFLALKGLDLETAPDATVNVLGTAVNTQVYVGLNAANMPQDVTVGSPVNQLDTIHGPLSVMGVTGQDHLVLSDQGTLASGLTYTLAGSTVSRTQVAPITFADVGDVVLSGGNGPDYYAIQGLPASTPVKIVAQGAGNVLTGPNQPNQWQLTALNGGTLDGLVSFVTMQNLIGGAAADAFQMAPAGVSGNIAGGAGTDTLDYSSFAADILVDLLTHRATAVGGLVFDIENVTGGAGDDILVGDANANILKGGDGRDILVGGGGSDALDGGAGDDILIGGVTAYDANTPALLALRAEWSQSNETYQQRFQHLFHGGGQNGSFVLNPTTVFDDGAADLLTGGAGQDWFFFNPTQDTITDHQPAEKRTPIV
jgi:Ca2+-binding RTX toxin-like protein